MANVRFHEALSIKIDFDPEDLKSQACQIARPSFQRNIERAIVLLGIPGYASLTASRWTSAAVQAQHERFGVQVVAEAEVLAAKEEIERRTMELMNENMQMPKTTKEQWHLKLTIQFEDFADRGGQHYQGALEAVLVSVVIQMWSAVEVMFGDLWELVVNEHPSHLASLLGRPSAQGEKDADKKKIPLELLEKYNFNLSSVMGTILKPRFNFTVLSSAKEAYALAFRDGGEKVQEAICSESLRCLAAIRNLLVHKGGVIDGTFMRDSSGISGLDMFRNLGEGQRIFIDGITFKNIVEPALLSAAGLITSVDTWLSNNQPT